MEIILDKRVEAILRDKLGTGMAEPKTTEWLITEFLNSEADKHEKFQVEAKLAAMTYAQKKAAVESISK